jgi:hypothetical protein
MAKRLGNALFIIGAVLTSIGEFVLFGHHTNPEINGLGADRDNNLLSHPYFGFRPESVPPVAR